MPSTLDQVVAKLLEGPLPARVQDLEGERGLRLFGSMGVTQRNQAAVIERVREASA